MAISRKLLNDGEVVLHDIPQVEQVQRTLNELLQDERSGDGV